MILATARHYLERARSIGQVRMLRCFGYRGSRDVHLSAGVRITDPARVLLGEQVNIARDVKIECLTMAGRAEAGMVVIGDRVFIGERSTIISNARITIGRLTMIGHGVSIVDFNHGTSPEGPMRDQLGTTAEVAIGEDCWLGAGVIVLPGVTVGDGTVVGAGSVVTRSLPKNVIAGGIPAKVLRDR
jgi:acetyltransferase-like isoleucine patch superfamily enzyme